MNITRILVGALLPAGLVAGLLAAAPGDRAPAGGAAAGLAQPNLFPGNTKPINKADLSLKQADVAWKVNIKEGDHVKEGDELLIEDIREEVINQQILEAEVNSGVAVKAAEKTAELKKLEYDKVLLVKENASRSEIDHGRVDWELSKLEIEKAKVELEQKRLQMERQKELLAHRMRIIAPFDGIIQEIHIRKGEVVDPQKPAITMVNTSVLSVECFLPVSLANKLERQLIAARKADPKADLQLNVIIPDVDKPVMGKLTYFDPLADAGADQRRVWVEIPNPDELPAGMQVQVQIPPAGVAKAQANGQ